MGKKRISLKKIEDEKSRQVTFSKRKYGLMKKSFELSVLCGCQVGLIMFSPSNKLYQFASSNMDDILMQYTTANGNLEKKTAEDMKKELESKEAGAVSTDLAITAGTSASFESSPMASSSIAPSASSSRKMTTESAQTTPVSLYPSPYGMAYPMFSNPKLPLPQMEDPQFLGKSPLPSGDIKRSSFDSNIFPSIQDKNDDIGYEFLNVPGLESNRARRRSSRLSQKYLNM